MEVNAIVLPNKSEAAITAGVLYFKIKGFSGGVMYVSSLGVSKV